MDYKQPLQSAILIRRYKRFLADIELPDGSQTTIHCPNTGSMKNCWAPGDKVWFSESDNPKRKYPFTWELVETDRGDVIGINSALANTLVKEAINGNRIAELAGYDEVRSEVKYGSEASRIDLLLSKAGRRDCYVEVKSVTLLEQPVSSGRGVFPDAVSDRGSKHLRELADMARQGARAVLFYCVQHSGIRSVHPAKEIDPAYCDALAEAQDAGLEVLAYKCQLSPTKNVLRRQIRFGG